MKVELISSLDQIIPRTLSVTRVCADRLERGRQRVRAIGDRPVELADHVAAERVAHEPPRADVGPAPLDDAGEQVALADDALHPVLDQPVAHRDERADPAARDQRLERDVVQRRLDRDQREVELALELVDDVTASSTAVRSAPSCS